MRYGGAALASAGLAALSAKLMALTLGPAGTGLMGTLQQIRQTGVVISTWNGQTAIVQGGAAAGPQDRSAFYRTALALVALGVLATGLLVAGGGGGWLPGGWLRGGFADWGFRVWGLVALSCGTVFVSGWMNAAGAWRQAAALQMAGPAVTAGALTVLAPSEATPGLVLDLATAAAAASFALALGFAWARRSDFRGPGPWFSIRMARRFLATAGAAGFSSAFASLSLLYVRSGIASEGGWGESGLFDAGWAISMNGMGLVLAGLQGYYLPAVAAAPAGERSEVIRATLAFVIALALPFLTALVCLKPLLLELLYAAGYAGAAHTLRWTLAADYLKAAGWVCGMPMLACGHWRALWAADLAAYAAFGTGWSVLRGIMRPAEAGGAAFLALSAVHLGVTALYAWRAHGLRLDARTGGLWLSGALILAGASYRNWSRTAVDGPETAAWCLLAAGVAAGFVYAELRGAGERARPER